MALALLEYGDVTLVSDVGNATNANPHVNFERLMVRELYHAMGEQGIAVKDAWRSSEPELRYESSTAVAILDRSAFPLCGIYYD